MASCQNCGGARSAPAAGRRIAGDVLYQSTRQVVATRDVERHLPEARGLRSTAQCSPVAPVDEHLELEDARTEHRPHGIDGRRR